MRYLTLNVSATEVSGLRKQRGISESVKTDEDPRVRRMFEEELVNAASKVKRTMHLKSLDRGEDLS
jgi:hypothetical protein